ncbi:F-type H+-transporting ATPase subunit b [Breoghania corrubedonensis]|uniref:ATP synthase subunit b n=1 Tax=Breoghania corrubedonensis TaxID=665038 RepID=A0A2T5VEQ6_9HYPH|nr:F0F1 ATP synthase subunit B [Breoghania corrubedonensis]PTW62228.1 F-type H+-transporting ATPase subunit b [Breoghania corrubedonensis]
MAQAQETQTNETSAGHGATTAHTEVPHDGGHAQTMFPPFNGETFPSQLLWLAITFGAFYYMMSKMALPRIGGILEDRRDRIASDIAEAGRLKQETEVAIASYEQALAEARQKAGGIAQATRDKLAGETEAKRAAVEKDLNAKLEEAEKRISGIKEAALADVGEIANEATNALVESLLGKAPTKTETSKAVSASMS